MHTNAPTVRTPPIHTGSPRQPEPPAVHVPPPAQGSDSGYPKFLFYEYNPRRRARGVESVRIDVQWAPDEAELLWMSQWDLQMNIKEFGNQPALVRGLACYQNHRLGHTEK